MDLFLKKGREATRWQAEAREYLQWATEAIIRGLFGDGVEAMVHAKRVTLMPKDLHLSIRMRGYDKGILDGWTPGKPKPSARARTRAKLSYGSCELDFTL